MTRAVYRLDETGKRVYLGHVPDGYELRDGEHFYQTKVLPEKLSDNLVMKILDSVGHSLYRKREDLNIYYDQDKTGCFVDCYSYGMLIKIELYPDYGKIVVQKEGEFSGMQYFRTFKLEEIINDNNQNE
ncbi:MAG: hypothetical protein [Bacteriophage sp.]|nr:MAG: hypothetical protein [Bacteriophage sp.]